MKNVKKLLSIFLLFCCFLSFSYSENFYKISETELIQLENINNEQIQQIETLKKNFNELKETMKQQEAYYQELEKESFKKEIKIGSSFFFIGLGIGTLVGTITFFSLNK